MTVQEAKALLFRVLTKDNHAYRDTVNPASLLSALNDRPIVGEEHVNRTSLKVVKQ